MINLLPPTYKKELRAARINVILRRYIFLQIIAAAMLAAMIGASYFLISMTKAQAEEEIATNRAQASEYNDIDQKAKEFQANLSTAKGILDKEVRYSKVILAISKELPSGVILDTLTLDATTFGQPTSLSAKAKSYDDALRLKDSFDKSDIFKDVRLESVSQSTDEESDYPVDVRINVTIREDIIK